MGNELDKKLDEIRTIIENEYTGSVHRQVNKWTVIDESKVLVHMINEIDMIINKKDWYNLLSIRIGKVSVDSVGYPSCRFEGKRARIHRLLIKCKTGNIIDHIDGNKLNNIRSNLRETTQGTNCRNSDRAKYGKQKRSPHRRARFKVSKLRIQTTSSNS